MRFHAVMLDETRCEFGTSVEADSREEAYEWLEENYPESQCVQLESNADTAEREARIYQRALAEEEGIFDEWDYEQEWS